MTKIQSENTTAIETPIVETQSKDDAILMGMIMDLQKEVRELRNKDLSTSIKDKKEHYKWPLAFRYKTRDWEPVLDYKSVKKDSTKPLLYKSGNGDMFDNHMFEITTTSGVLKKPVLLYDFSMWHGYSKTLPAWAILFDWDVIKCLEIPKHKAQLANVEWFVFNTEEYWEIKVSSKAIN